MKRISVAIVDDDPSVRVSLHRFCMVSDLDATAYASGREFLNALAAGAARPDCLLLDAHMPEMTGLELQRHLVARGVRIPTVVVTADDAPDVPAQYFTDGSTGYLRKPFSGETLLAAIEKVLRGGSTGA